MRYIKSYKLFESAYSKEEYFEYITMSLSTYSVNIRELMDQYESTIMDYYNSGQDPKILLDKIINDLELETGGFPTIQLPGISNRQIKYL